MARTTCMCYSCAVCSLCETRVESTSYVKHGRSKVVLHLAEEVCSTTAVAKDIVAKEFVEAWVAGNPKVELEVSSALAEKGESFQIRDVAILAICRARTRWNSRSADTKRKCNRKAKPQCSMRNANAQNAPDCSGADPGQPLGRAHWQQQPTRPGQ